MIPSIRVHVHVRTTFMSDEFIEVLSFGTVHPSTKVYTSANWRRWCAPASHP